MRYPDILAITARDHPLLNTCHQISDEGFDAFLSNNEFVQDILVTSLTASACKFVSLFIKGIGDRVHLVRRMGLAIEEPDEDLLAKLMDWLIMVANAERIRTGVMILRMKLKRPTKGPPLFSPMGESWTIAPKDEDVMIMNVVVGDERASWAEFEKSKELDWDGRQRGTDRVLDSCRVAGMESVKDREKAWREERRVWWEETWQAMREKYRGWLEVMDDLKPRPKVLVGCGEDELGLRRSKNVSRIAT
ncbi:hypothetical protein E4T49_06041 [Aureobasidium sp. EXF-10728]|nr:hypothetical protein E4T49_06041 [Aureobasidium sp. EXF-10728]